MPRMCPLSTPDRLKLTMGPTLQPWGWVWQDGIVDNWKMSARVLESDRPLKMCQLESQGAQWELWQMGLGLGPVRGLMWPVWIGTWFDHAARGGREDGESTMNPADTPIR
jgi:hypothetical protein